MKILSIIGARPQFVKAAPVSRALRRVGQEVLVHTGQHYDFELSRVFFQQLALPEPDYNLEVGSGPHGQQTGLMLARVEEVLLRERPDAVLVYGDTNSTVAGALAAAKLDMPVAHVEAGLRCGNRAMPEEQNRIVTDHLARLLFCPNRQAVATLAGEGITQGVYAVGDVMFDALQEVLHDGLNEAAVLSDFELERGQYVLATVHRAQNTDDIGCLRDIVDGLGRVSPETVVLPAHPRLRVAIERLALALPKNIRLVKPLGFVEMVALERNARVIATDSGGVQKEAYWLGVPCVTLRLETEWVETVEGGWNILVGSDSERIAEALAEVARLKPARTAQERPPGDQDGRASQRIADILASEVTAR